MNHVLAILAGLFVLTPLWTILLYRPFKKANDTSKKKMLIIASLIGMGGAVAIGLIMKLLL